MSYYLTVHNYDYQMNIIQPGTCDGIYMVLSGVANIYLRGGGTQIDLDHLGVGSIIGLYSNFTSENQICGAKAGILGGCACIKLSNKTIEKIRARWI